MKRGVSFLGLMLITSFLYFGCASSSIMYLGTFDPNVPDDQLVTLEIAGGLKVVSFNGLDVSWGQNGSIPGEGIGSKSWEAQKWVVNTRQ